MNCRTFACRFLPRNKPVQFNRYVYMVFSTHLKYSLVLHLCLLALVAGAQGLENGRVKGFVKTENGSAAAGASILVQPINQTFIATNDGSFGFSVPAGKYQLLVTHTGYESISQDVTVSSNNTTSVSIVLRKPQFGEMKEVKVRSVSEKRVIETQGFAVNVVETKEASLRNFQTNELLDRSVGVRVRQNGGLGSAVNYNLNGMSGNSVRIFIDGIPVSTYGASFSLNSIPPAMIERIEVYKGVIPAHLSDDALGGAINVILKKAAREMLSASISYGSFNTLQAHAAGVFRNDKNGLTLKASGFYNSSDNDYDVWGKFVRNILPNGRYEYVKAKRFNDAYRSGGALVELGFTDVKWADQFFVGYNFSDDYNEIQHGTYMSIPYNGRYTESQAHVFSLNYRKKDLFTKGLELTFNGMHSRRKEFISDTVRWNYSWYGEQSVGLSGEPILRPSGAQQGAPTLNHIDRNITTFRAGLSYDILRNHRLVVNHIFYNIDRTQQDMMRNAVEREFIGTRDLVKNISSVAWEMQGFNTRFRSNVFAKFYNQQIDRMNPVLREVNGEMKKEEDRTSGKNRATGYGIALSYAITEKLMLLTSAERAVRMPSESETFGSPGDNITENLGIRPEVSNNLNIGLKTGPFVYGKHRLTISVNGFIRDTRDKIVQRINPRLNDAVQTDPFENLGKTMSKGFESELRYAYDNNFQVQVNFSKFNSVFNVKEDANGRPYEYYNQQLPNEPFFTVNSSVQYGFKNIIQKGSKLNLYYHFGFVERFYTTWLEIEDFRTPRQYIQDLGMSYVFPNKRFTVSADARNIFDKQAYDNFAVQKPGRAFYLKFNYTLHQL